MRAQYRPKSDSRTFVVDSYMACADMESIGVQTVAQTVGHYRKDRLSGGGGFSGD